MRPLYAVAYELYNRKGDLIKGDIEYMHAEDAGHAKNQFCLSHPNRRTHKIIGSSLVIGFYALDDNADVISV